MARSVYAMALAVQDACNPIGLAYSLVNEVLPAIREELTQENRFSTEAICGHPAFVLFVDKLQSMVRCENIMDAYRDCREHCELEEMPAWLRPR